VRNVTTKGGILCAKLTHAMDYREGSPDVQYRWGPEAGVKLRRDTTASAGSETHSYNKA
jgi:hypothetical protein